ncbi:hypothetical protein [Streptomyces sp. SID13588]|uniref:hypothetical protein n=1 Tax=Streptomyces sp. SID13588 TaxID=2706051 RepID=UPI0013CBC50B|nr:hypothetical protein [Streptomyces sp. SID13588]NEA72336.1 hypothetical protein [Streptomyces sp. SID13588]
MKTTFPGPAWQPSIMAQLRVHAPDHDRRAWVVPTVASVVAVPLLAVDALMFLASQIPPDSCDSDPCAAPGFHGSLGAPCLVFLAGVAVLLCWVLPWRRRFRTVRIVAAVESAALAAAALWIYYAYLRKAS